MGKFITITLNPAIDYVMEVSDFSQGETSSVINSYTYPAGKGVNVARALACMEEQTVAIGIIGENDVKFFDTIGNAWLTTDWATSNQSTRKNITICDIAKYTETHLRNTVKTNEAFPTTAIIDKLHTHCEKDDIVILSGSQPKNAPDDTLYRLCMECKKIGAKAVVDSSGAPMLRALEASPYMIKPNVKELEELTGRTFDGQEQMAQGMFDVALKYDIQLVVLSMGKDGAMIFDKKEDRLYRGCSRMGHTNFMPHAVGSGDAMVAGMCAELMKQKAASNILKKGIACGTANLYTTIPG